MEFFVIVPYVDECSKNIRWENHFESFPVLLYRVEEAQTPQAVELQLVLDLHIFLGIVEVGLGLLTFTDSWAVVHQYLSYYVRSVQSDLDVVSIIERQIGQCS